MSEVDRFRRIGRELTQEEEANKLVDVVLLPEAARIAAQDTSNKVKTGFTDLDSCLDGGFREGDFTVISGIPGEGKTTLARMFTLNLADIQVPSLWFSHEMTTRELWDSFVKMGATDDLIGYVPIELEDDIGWMFRHIDHAIEKHGVKAVFIDTLGDIVKSVKSQQEMGNYANYLAQICKDLRAFAVSRKIMIFAIAHATKQTRSKTNETDNSDIANSNGIPAAATNIFHIWRDEDNENMTFVKVGKSRRDGTAKGKKFKFKFENNRLIPQGAHLTQDDVWRKI